MTRWYFAALSVAVLALGWRETGAAEDIYQWKDETGQLHYSNRGGVPSGEPKGSGGGEGWESVLERNEGGPASIREKADAAINNLQLQVVRKKRDRDQAQAALESTQAQIGVASQRPISSEVPALRVREATQISELHKVDVELAILQDRIAKLRALKTVEKGDPPAQ